MQCPLSWFSKGTHRPADPPRRSVLHAASAACPACLAGGRTCWCRRSQAEGADSTAKVMRPASASVCNARVSCEHPRRDAVSPTRRTKHPLATLQRFEGPESPALRTASATVACRTVHRKTHGSRGRSASCAVLSKHLAHHGADSQEVPPRHS